MSDDPHKIKHIKVKKIKNIRDSYTPNIVGTAKKIEEPEDDYQT